MRRAGQLIERIADADNLRLAFWKAARGKRTKPEVLRFRENLNEELCSIREGFLSGCMAWGPYRTFLIRDPKERTISVAPFRDRVAQHAIMNVAEPVFEGYQIHDSYACRPGKGLDGAIDRSKRFSRAGDWYLKLDVRKYFDSIDHTALKRLLRRRFKDRRLLAVFDGIIDSSAAEPGRGLPIGNLTSQFFANHYLAVADHHIKETLRCRRYVRYMDDLVVWEHRRDDLRRIRDEIARFLDERLRLELKPPCLNACSRGMTFLGYRVFPGRLRLARRGRNRFRQKMRLYHQTHRDGAWDEQTLARHVGPLLAFVRRAESTEFRRRVLESLGLCPWARTA